MNQNLWLKYALYSFLGVLILLVLSGFMNSYDMQSMQMGGMNMPLAMQQPMMQMNGMNMSMQQPMMQMGGMNMPIQGMGMSNGVMGMTGSIQINGMFVYPLANGGMAIVPMNQMGNMNYMPTAPINAMVMGTMNTMPVVYGYGLTMPSMIPVANMPMGAMFNSLPMSGM